MCLFSCLQGHVKACWSQVTCHRGVFMSILEQHLRVPENHGHRLLFRGEMEWNVCRDIIFFALQRNSVMCNSVFFPLWVQLLNHHVVTELMLIDVLMNNMMERISDPSCAVRMLAVRGLGNIAVGSPEKVGILWANICSVRNSSSAHFFSATRWISTPRSCWQPWVPAWRRRMIQVSRQHSSILLKTEEKLQQSFLWLFWFISVISCSFLYYVTTLFLKGAGKDSLSSPLCLQVNWLRLKPCQVSLKSFSIWTKRMCTYWLCTSSWRSNHFWKV